MASLRIRHRPDLSRSPGEATATRSEEHTSELQSRLHLVCRLLLEKKNTQPTLILRILHCRIFTVQAASISGPSLAMPPASRASSRCDTLFSHLLSDFPSPCPASAR